MPRRAIVKAWIKPRKGRKGYWRRHVGLLVRVLK